MARGASDDRLSHGTRTAFVLIACLLATGADAQPFGFLFDDARPPRSGRPRHSARPTRPEARALTPDAPPIPVPRPHFAGDPVVPPSAPGTAPARLPGTPTPTAPAQTPVAAPVSPPTLPPVAPSGATTAQSPAVPVADPGCLARLKVDKVEATPIALGPQPDARCTVADPVTLDHLSLLDGGSVRFPDRPVISCTTAATFAAYVRELLAPLAKGSLGIAGGTGALTAVWTGPGLECRSRDHVLGAKLSAHGQGLAVDIAQIGLADGRRIEVGAPADPAATVFETAARAGACGYFHTVLGPGSDSYHRTHWHFDLEVRGRSGDSKFCK